MRRSACGILLGMLALIAAIVTPAALCRGGEVWDSCCSGCSTCASKCTDYCGSTSCCCGLRKVCEFRLVDGCTHAAWHRTWNAPNALATPLRQYYVPRMPSCYGVDGYSWRYRGGDEQYYMPSCMDCEKVDGAAAVAVMPMEGFSPQSERLGQIRNELDVVGGVATPAHAAATAR